MPALNTYACGIVGTEEYDSVVFAHTRSKARYQRWLDLKDPCPDITIMQITSRRVAASPFDADFARTARYRGVPWARIGMPVRLGLEGDRWHGVIVGKNSSANFNVLFTTGKYTGAVLNCHPNWQMQYLVDGEWR